MAIDGDFNSQTEILPKSVRSAAVQLLTLRAMSMSVIWLANICGDSIPDRLDKRRELVVVRN
jgi:hypothetical protein